MNKRRIAPLALAVALAGCGQPSDPSRLEPGERNPTPTLAVGKPGVPAGFERLHQSFKQATRKDAPRDARPPDRTMTGRAVAKVYEDVVRLWDTIKFVKPDGTRLHYSATLDTSMGVIEIALDDERAPNHVRNFIALSRAHYYDGLQFDHILGTETYEELQAGSPLGAEDPTKNSVGYWLEPEISGAVKHEAGSVGACHGKERNTAGCKFYISLTSAPDYDGNYTLFGKVTRGLDVVEKIGRQPVIIDEEDPAQVARPLEPVVIRKVTIQTR